MAHYWTGGAPVPRRISNLSADGAYIEAPDEFSPGTLVTLILQPGTAPLATGEHATAGRAPSACKVEAAVVRSAPGGFAVQFVFGHRDQRVVFQGFLRHSMPPNKPENGSST